MNIFIGSAGIVTSSQTLSTYQLLSRVFLVAAIILAIVAIVIWFTFDVKHALVILTGFGAKKEIARIHSEASMKGIHSTRAFGSKKGVVSWMLGESGTMATTVLDNSYENATVVLQPQDDQGRQNETVLLADAVNETTVLNTNEEKVRNDQFIFEKDIVNVATEEKLI